MGYGRERKEYSVEGWFNNNLISFKDSIRGWIMHGNWALEGILKRLTYLM